jgi:hypothetical protein
MLQFPIPRATGPAFGHGGTPRAPASTHRASKPPIAHGMYMSPTRLARLFRSPAAALLLLVPLLFAGCNLKSGGFVITKPAHLRFMNALVDSTDLTVNVVNNGTIVSGLPFQGVTNYIDLNAGNQQIQIIANGTSTIYDATQLYVDDSSYTFVVYGTTASATVLLVPDVVTNTPGDGVFVLRAINAAYGNGGIDVYVTAPGVPLDNQSPNFSGLACKPDAIRRSTPVPIRCASPCPTANR